MNKNKLSLLKFLTIIKLVMIQIFKNIVPRLSTTWISGAIKSLKMLQKINGPTRHCFGKIKRNKNSLPNLSIKTGLLSRN